VKKEMRKTTVIFLTLMLAIPLLVTPVFAASPNPELGPPTYVLNVLGKKEGWSPNGDFDNPDRHTIFIPENGICDIYMTSGPEFAVIDGDGVDGEARFELEKGRYTVRIAALGKPGYELDLKGNSLFETDGDDYLLTLGDVTLKRNKGTPTWEDGTPLFMIEWSEILQVLDELGIVFDDTFTEADLAAQLGYNIGDDVWIFDFLEWLSENEESGIYFWNITNSGIKHFQVRFY
jgi:hypothetical protein